MNRGHAVVPRRRGAPLGALALIIGGWLAARVLWWQAPLGYSEIAPSAWSHLPEMTAKPETQPGQLGTRHIALAGRDHGAGKAPAVDTLAALSFADGRPARLPAALPIIAESLPSNVVGNQLLLAAAFAHVEFSPEITAHFATLQPTPPRTANATGPLVGRTIARPETTSGRWSGDGWLFLRHDATRPTASAGPSYGRSQAGAVLRYRLAGWNRHRPVVYARADRTLSGPREVEVAGGFAARPNPQIPINLAAELRVREGPEGREVRPAAFAVTELPPVWLPLGLRAEAYAQAGYVGGRFATAFVDAQARVDGPVARFADKVEIRAGGAAWGGAEKDASRLDLGPSATLTIPIGRTLSRLAVDYRLRIAGDAAPDSGAALTFSASF